MLAGSPIDLLYSFMVSGSELNWIYKNSTNVSPFVTSTQLVFCVHFKQNLLLGDKDSSSKNIILVFLYVVVKRRHKITCHFTTHVAKKNRREKAKGISLKRQNWFKTLHHFDHVIFANRRNSYSDSYIPLKTFLLTHFHSSKVLYSFLARRIC